MRRVQVVGIRQDSGTLAPESMTPFSILTDLFLSFLCYLSGTLPWLRIIAVGTFLSNLQHISGSTWGVQRAPGPRDH